MHLHKLEMDAEKNESKATHYDCGGFQISIFAEYFSIRSKCFLSFINVLCVYVFRTAAQLSSSLCSIAK